MDFECSLEPPHQGVSNEHPQSMLLSFEQIQRKKISLIFNWKILSKSHD